MRHYVRLLSSKPAMRLSAPVTQFALPPTILASNHIRSLRKNPAPPPQHVAGFWQSCYGSFIQQPAGGGLVIRARWLCLALVFGATAIGCATQQFIQADPANHRWDASASAYSLDGCQEKMNELAGGPVQMTGHSQQILQSVLNFGVTPFYRCSGTIADAKLSS